MTRTLTWQTYEMHLVTLVPSSHFGSRMAARRLRSAEYLGLSILVIRGIVVDEVDLDMH
jgi:hypothetical protein